MPERRDRLDDGARDEMIRDGTVGNFARQAGWSLADEAFAEDDGGARFDPLGEEHEQRGPGGAGSILPRLIHDFALTADERSRRRLSWVRRPDRP